MAKQLDLSERKDINPFPKHLERFEQTDTITGEIFMSRTPDHYEPNDGVPHSPELDLPRPSLRERVEALLSRGIDPRDFVQNDDSQDGDFGPDDDQDEPLTVYETRDLLRQQIDAAKASNPNPPAAGPGTPVPEPAAPSPVPAPAPEPKT